MADRWRIAVHEAGHCVAARVMGLPVGGVAEAVRTAFAARANGRGPRGDGADDPDHRAQQDPEQHGVFDERRPVLVLEPERILLELVQKHRYVKHNFVLFHCRPIVGPCARTLRGRLRVVLLDHAKEMLFLATIADEAFLDAGACHLARASSFPARSRAAKFDRGRLGLTPAEGEGRQRSFMRLSDAGVVRGHRAISWALMDDDDRWRACVHECGHAVAAKLLNVPLGYVWLEPSPQAQFSHQCGAASICAMMAGGAAERLVFGDCLGIRTRTGGMRRR